MNPKGEKRAQIGFKELRSRIDQLRDHYGTENDSEAVRRAINQVLEVPLPSRENYPAEALHRFSQCGLADTIPSIHAHDFVDTISRSDELELLIHNLRSWLALHLHGDALATRVRAGKRLRILIPLKSLTPLNDLHTGLHDDIQAVVWLLETIHSHSPRDPFPSFPNLQVAGYRERIIAGPQRFYLASEERAVFSPTPFLTDSHTAFVFQPTDTPLAPYAQLRRDFDIIFQSSLREYDILGSWLQSRQQNTIQ